MTKIPELSTKVNPKIDKETFEKLCQLQCTLEEVCFFFHCDHKTLNAWCKSTYADEPEFKGAGKPTFSHVFSIKRQGGILSLRRDLFQQSKNKPAVSIFLAKNYLGMTDNPMPPSSDSQQESLARAINRAVRAMNADPETDGMFESVEDSDG